MKSYITPSTLANTVRMGAHSRRPKAVFLASDESDAQLAETLLTQGRCRVIQAHTRANAVTALDILIKSGWEGILTAVNTNLAPPTEQEIAAEARSPAKHAVAIEGMWEAVQNHGTRLTGQRVRVTVLDETPSSDQPADKTEPNYGMLAALTKVAQLTQSLTPKQDKSNYLREARGGAMYGYTDED